MNRQIKKMFCKVKLHGDTFESRNEVKCSDENLSSFFQDHFTRDYNKTLTPNEISLPFDFTKPLQMSDTKILEDIPDSEEIEEVTRHLKNDKASMDISANILKYLIMSKPLCKPRTDQTYAVDLEN